ncbi:MAG: AAA family ATPase [Gammaproteobacteria bacterium]|nr:AAA family ATPase [Gammaproteobacteria bacterium]
MYEKFYHLKEKPFSLLPDPEYLYLSKKHKMALTLLEYGILNQAGFCVVSGQAGAGKTTLIRHLLNLFDDEISVGLLTNTHQSFDELLTWILLAFEQDYSGKTKAALYQTFVDFLIDQYAKKRHTVLIVDEAQNMSPETLEELRMLSNINSEKDQLLQIILVGQPRLLENLRRPDLKQFAQRVAVDYNLEQLDQEETTAYIQHRLKVAGGHPAIFHRDACKLVYKYSKGVPRLINLLCDTALVYGYSEQAKIIDEEIIMDVVRERDEQGMLTRFEDLNEEVTSVFLERLLKDDEPAISLVKEEVVEQVFEQQKVACAAQSTSSTVIEQNIKPSIQLVPHSKKSQSQHKNLIPNADVCDETDYLLQAMELSKEEKSSSQEKTKDADSMIMKEPIEGVEKQAVTTNIQSSIDTDVNVNINKQDINVMEINVSEQEQMNMDNEKPFVPERVYIQPVNSTSKIGFGFIGFSFGALLSIVVLVFALFNKESQVVDVVAKNTEQQRIPVLEERITTRLSDLEKERDLALEKLNAIQRERDAQLAQVKAEEEARAAELKAKLALQEEKLRAEKAANAVKRAEMARLEREVQKRKDIESALALQRKRDQELAAQKIKESLLQAQREQEIAAQQKLVQSQSAQEMNIQKQQAELVTELKPSITLPAVEKEDITTDAVVSVKVDDTENTKAGFLSDPCKGPTARFMSNCKK